MIPSFKIVTLKTGKKLLDLSNPLVMGIINLTPDSFFDGGKYNLTENALQHAEDIIAKGAAILDVGAYSSRPGALFVSEKEERNRLIPFIEKLVRKLPNAVISVDTFRAGVAEQAVQAGATIINDISGGNLDPKMFETVGRLNVPYILMHMRGTPETMQQLTHYEDVVADICTYFIEKISKLREYGVKDIILDPGFGFAKTLAQNYEILYRFDEFKTLKLPLLGAVSRKSMIYRTLNCSPAEALNGTTVLHTVLLMKGAQIIRAHDVAEAEEVILLSDKWKEVEH